jgi:hypothetical protein
MPLKQHVIFYAKALKHAATSYLGDDVPAILFISSGPLAAFSGMSR